MAKPTHGWQGGPTDGKADPRMAGRPTDGRAAPRMAKPTHGWQRRPHGWQRRPHGWGYGRDRKPGGVGCGL